MNQRVIIITGASAGIGRAIAVDLARSGARVVLNARRRDRLELLAQEINEELGQHMAAIAPGDTASPETITSLFEVATASFDQAADGVVVNAGRGLRGGVHDSDETEWEEMIRTNLLGAARVMREAATRMTAGVGGVDWKKRAHDIVVIGSNVGRHISPFSSMYGSTKFAVNALAESLRRSLAPQGIRVTLVEPGFVRSEFQEVAGYDPDWFDEVVDRIGPVLEPEDVARAVTFVMGQPASVHINDLLIRPTRQDYP